MSKSAWISAGKISAAAAAVALLLGVFFQGQAQQRSDMADVRAELRSSFTEVNGRLDSISRNLVTLRERVARIEGHLALSADISSKANVTPQIEKDG